MNIGIVINATAQGKLTYNGSQVYLVADLEAQNLNLIQNENRNTKLG